MNPVNNFRNYQERIHSSSIKHQPKLPYFGLFLRDFTALKENNDMLLSANKTGAKDGEVDVDVESIRMLARRIRSLEAFQANPYILAVSVSMVTCIDI